MEPVIVTGIVFVSLIAVVKLISDHITRRRLIERGLVDDRARRMLAGSSELTVLNNLKWGMVLLGIGIASLLSYLMPYYFDDEGALGLVFIFAGLGFLIYYPIAQKKMREIERQDREVNTTPSGN